MLLYLRVLREIKLMKSDIVPNMLLPKCYIVFAVWLQIIQLSFFIIPTITYLIAFERWPLINAMYIQKTNVLLLPAIHWRIHDRITVICFVKTLLHLISLKQNKPVYFWFIHSAFQTYPW